jgi:hypothetical protein
MMGTGWRRDDWTAHPRSYGVGRRSLFILSMLRCQARVLECQALKAGELDFCILLKKAIACLVRRA